MNTILLIEDNTEIRENTVNTASDIQNESQQAEGDDD